MKANAHAFGVGLQIFFCGGGRRERSGGDCILKKQEL
jgi:hypothetical protein